MSKEDQGPVHSTLSEIGGDITADQYKLAIFDQRFLLREEMRPVRLQLELLRPELILEDKNIKEGIVFFGSAAQVSPVIAKEQLAAAQHAHKKNPKDPKLKWQLQKARNIVNNASYLQQATELAYLASCDDVLNYVVTTGGGPGFMEAANRGAYEANASSVAHNMILTGEQIPNPFVTPELTFQFHYFAIRKMHLLLRAKAAAVFPGGFGTMDELFELLTLMQHHKIDRFPLLLFNRAFWKRIINFEGLVCEGTISESDLELFQFVETADEAWRIIQEFYGDR